MICITTFLFSTKTMAQSPIQESVRADYPGDLWHLRDIGVGSNVNPSARIEIFNGETNLIDEGYRNKRPFLISGSIKSLVGYIGSNPVYFPITHDFFTVDKKGYVGIDVLEPLTKLHLHSGIFTFTKGSLQEPSANWQIHGTEKAFAIKDQLASEYRFWIDKEDGNVGIGTNSPDEKLEVEGNALVNGFIKTQTATGYIKMYSANNSFAHFYTDRPKFYFNKTIQVDGAINSHTTDLQLQTQGTTRVNVKGNGQVDIGTLHINAGAHTDYKLAVDGKIVSKKVVVTLDNWADHVFDKNYKLKTLAEVEAFITKENHLPEIPSEQKVLEEGIELGEMNKLLLLKVEELTLYMIQMQKEIDELKNAGE